jgi:hypothetical protein
LHEEGIEMERIRLALAALVFVAAAAGAVSGAGFVGLRDAGTRSECAAGPCRLEMALAAVSSGESSRAELCEVAR